MARLLLILPEYPPSVGGMQTHAIHAVRHWRARHEVRVLTYRASGVHDEAERVLSRLSYWHNVREIERAARDFRPDLIYSSTVYYGTLAARLNLPVLCRSVGNDVQRPWIAYPFERGARLLAQPTIEDRLYQRFRKLRKPDRLDRLFREERERLLAQALHGNAHVFANSHYTRDLLTARGYPSARISVVAGGVDAAHFLTGPRRRRSIRRFLCVCRLVAKKGLETLLTAWRSVERPGLCLRIVGDGPLRSELEAQAGPGVEFTGRVPYRDIARQYAWADAFVLPSVEHLQRGGRRDVETMGRVFCEAGAAALPVIATRTGGVPSVVGDNDNGLLVEPGQAAELAAAMRALIEDPSLAQRLGRRGRERAVTEWDWRVVFARQDEVIEESVGALVSSSSSNIR